MVKESESPHKLYARKKMAQIFVMPIQHLRRKGVL
jgi:hypothetical protein